MKQSVFLKLHFLLNDHGDGIPYYKKYPSNAQFCLSVSIFSFSCFKLEMTLFASCANFHPCLVGFISVTPEKVSLTLES
jgi:hypothetical protein